MARTALGPAPGSHVEYVPEAFDNKANPPPIVVTLLAPSEKERRLIDLDPENTLLRPGNEQAAADEQAGRLTGWQEKLLRRYVLKVTNYNGRGRVPVVDAGTLISHGERELYSEIYRAVLGLLYLSDEAAKFYAESFDSTPQAIRPSSGTADNAGPAVLSESATVEPRELTPTSSTSPQTASASTSVRRRGSATKQRK